MRFPSLQSLFQSVIHVFKRFPLETLCALAATVITCRMINLKSSADEEVHFRLLMICNLGLVAFLAASLYAESKRWVGSRKLILRLAVSGLLVVLFFVLNLKLMDIDILRFVILTAVFHLSVSFAPFLGKKSIQEFWGFNKTLFLRILSAVLYSGTLYIGLALALLSFDKLFDVKIKDESYLYLWAVIGILFNTLFFLAGVPEVKYDADEKEQSYPKGLKLFTQYVLIPIVSIYSIILLLYAGKILLTWELPKGWVSMLILAYAIVGILSLLLIHPIRKQAENRWMYLFSRYFYIALIPLLILFWLAIYKRVSDYGITEERYILIVAAIWLSFIAFWNIFTQGDNIKMIPISLASIFALTVFGPQSAFTVSKNSQLKRLKHLLKQGKADEAYNVVTYLGKQHGASVLQPFVKNDIEKIKAHYEKEDKSARYARINSQAIDSVRKLIKVKNKPLEVQYSSEYTNFYRKNESIIPFSSDYSFIGLYSYSAPFTYPVLQLNYSMNSLDGFNIRIGDDSTRIDFKPFFKRLPSQELQRDSIPDKEMLVEHKLKNWKIIILFDYINFNKDKNLPNNYSFNLLLKRREEN